MDTLGRRAFLAGAAGALAACAPARGRTQVRLGHSSAAVAAVAAAATGIFERHGLDIQLTPIQNGPMAVAAVNSGALDFTFGDFLGWVAALTNGFVDTRLLAPANETGNLALIARPDGGVARPADLIGRRVGVSAAPVFGLSIRLWLAQNGIDPAQVPLVVVGPGAEHALGRGDIDALLVQDPHIYRAGQLYGARLIAEDPTSAVMPAGAARACYYVNRRFLEDNPDTVATMAAALREGALAFENASQRRKTELSAPYIGMSVEQMEREMPGLADAYRHSTASVNGFSLEANQAWVDIAAAEGAIARREEIAPYVLDIAQIPARAA